MKNCTAQTIMVLFTKAIQEGIDLPNDLFTLSYREQHIILLFAQDLTVLEIADKLCLAPKSVRNHKQRIDDKLNLKGRNKIDRYARKIGVLLLPCQEFMP